MSLWATSSISGSSNALKKSLDDGSTWANTSANPTPGGSPRGLFVSGDEQTLIVGAATDVRRSTNGGGLWLMVVDPTGGVNHMCSSPDDENYIWLCTNSGYVCYSTDKGATWTEVKADVDVDYLYGISFASNSVGWATGGDSANYWYILKSTDGGATWTQQLKVLTNYQPIVKAVSSSVVYVVFQGVSGIKCYVTTDGGSTWNNYNTARLYNGARITAIGDRVWFTGKSGTTIEVNYSYDQGQTWLRSTIIDTYTPTTFWVPIDFATEYVGYVFGYHCFKSSDGGQTWTQKGICAQSTSQTPHSAKANPDFVTEIRSFQITETEPTDRTTQGTKISDVTPLNFGTIPQGQDSNIKCIIFRVVSLGLYSVVSNMKMYLYDRTAFVPATDFYADITDTWTQNKTPAQVKAGTPGVCPESEPGSPNLTKIGGGNITGIGHADTSQYIYFVLTLDAAESDGTRDFNYRIVFDYA